MAEELYEGAISFDWSLIFAPQSTFAIRLHVEREIKVNTQFATLRAKDGVVDSFMEAVGRRPSIYPLYSGRQNRAYLLSRLVRGFAT